MKFAWQLLLDLIFSEHKHSSANYHDILAFRIRDMKYKSPIEVALTGQGVIVDVGFLIILVLNPSTQLFQIYSELGNSESIDRLYHKVSYFVLELKVINITNN